MAISTCSGRRKAMQIAQLKTALSTVVAIPVIPFTADGKLDLAAYRHLIGRLAAAGITALTPNGNAGEFYSLSPTERCGVLETAVEASAGHAVLMAGVGFDVATAIDMAKFASRAGAECVMIHQVIQPYQSAEGWVAYHRRVAEAAPEL